MSQQPVSNNGEPSKFNKLLKGNEQPQSIQSRLPRANGGTSAAKTPAASAPAPTNDAPAKTKSSSSRIGPVFWTIASIISLLVNIGTVIALIVVVQMLGGPKKTFTLAQDQVNGLLGGLYTNFVKMDAASIKTTIHVEKDIPVQFTLNVSGTTDVTLTRDVEINGALVTVNTGGLNINNARANIVLPKGTLLPINIVNLMVPVDKTVKAVLDVPVDIPLNYTELHEPFVGLQKVIEPYYCFLQPNAQVNGINICAGANTILPVATPQGTVIP